MTTLHPFHSATNNISPLTLNPVRAIPLKSLLPAPPLRAKVFRGRRVRRMVQVLRIPPLSLVRVASSASSP
jgi:hypothetical protein